jgi:chromosome segregation ATPase
MSMTKITYTKVLFRIFAILHIAFASPLWGRIVQQADSSENKSLVSAKPLSRPSSVPTRRKHTEKKSKTKRPSVARPTQSELAQQLEMLEKQTEEAVSKLRKEALKKADIIQTEAEIEKLEAQRKQLEASLEGQGDPVSAEWKIEQTARFKKLHTILHENISSGEQDPDELADLEKLFEQQEAWFDTTVTQTKYVDDNHYQAILDKNQHLETIVTIQKDAERILQAKINYDTTTKKEYEQLKTALLYEVNARFENPSYWNHKIPSGTALVDAVQDAIKRAHSPEFKEEQVMSQKMRELKSQLEKAEKSLEEKNEHIVELKISQERSKEATDSLEQQTKATKEKLEALEQQQATRQQELSDLKKQMEEVKQAKTKVSEEKEELARAQQTIQSELNTLKATKAELDRKLQEEEHLRRKVEIRLEKEVGVDQNQTQELERLKARNERLQAVRNDLNQDLEEKTQKALELEIKLSQLKRGEPSLKLRPNDALEPLSKVMPKKNSPAMPKGPMPERNQRIRRNQEMLKQLEADNNAFLDELESRPEDLPIS